MGNIRVWVIKRIIQLAFDPKIHDFAKEEAIVFDIPGKIIVDGMGLEYQIIPGRYFKEDKLVCFVPGIDQESNQLLLIDKKCYMRYRIIWQN